MARLASLVVVLALLAAPAAALSASDYASAWPYKRPSDTGILTVEQWQSDAFNQKFGKYQTVGGVDPCVYWDAAFSSDMPPPAAQQYNVPGCAPVASPWIKLSPWKTRGWALYCPSSAPYNWNAEGPQNKDDTGKLDSPTRQAQYIKTSSFVDVVSFGVQEWTGPKPVGLAEYYATNWAFKHHTWRYGISCSPEPFTGIPQGGKYSRGEGPSGSLLRGSAIAQGDSDAAGAVTAATPIIGRRGPTRDIRRVDAANVQKTIEVDLVPQQVRRYQATCPKGQAPSFAHYGVGWFTGQRPSVADMTKVKDTQRSITRGTEVRIETKSIPRRTVRLQIHLGCTTKTA